MMRQSMFTECPQHVCEVSETVHDAVREVSASVHDVVHRRPWTWKAARNHRNNRTVPAWKQVTALFALVMALVSTLTEREPTIQIIVYLVFGAVFFMLDPLDMLTRILAPQSCRMLAISQIFIILGIIKPVRGYLIVIVMLIAGSLIAIQLFNTQWLAAYNWCMSAAVQKALLTDIENKSTKAWQAHGRRECRTLLHELGYDVKDSLLDILHRPVYICGFLNGYQKTTKYRKRLETLQNKADKYVQISKALKNENHQLKKEIAKIKETESEIRMELSESERMYFNLQNMFAESQAENRRLRIANEELIQELPETEELSGNLPEEAQIRRLLNQGMSIRKTAELLQIPKCRVERVKQQDYTKNGDIVVIGSSQQTLMEGDRKCQL